MDFFEFVETLNLSKKKNKNEKLKIAKDLLRIQAKSSQPNFCSDA